MTSLAPRLSFVLFILVVCSEDISLAKGENWETLNSAGMLAYQERDFLTAKELFERALDTLEQDEHPDPQSATTLNNLGAVHESLGEFEQAEYRYRNSLAVIETIQGSDHPDITMGLNNLASLYFSQQLFEKAEPLWQRALGISERILGDKHPHLVQTLVTLGIVTHIQRKFDQAETFYIRAIRITEHSLNPEHPRLISLYTRYGSLLRQANREDEATVVDRKIESLRSANTVSPENTDP
jgi:tetratricopeptide (TPR) repeat protein